MSTRPGRLYRRLTPTAPLFEFALEDGTRLTDSSITGVTIKRGDGSPGGGVSPSTLEVGLSGHAAVRSGLHCSLSLTTYAAQLLASRVGATASVIAPRFSGRIGRQHVDDRGRRQRATMLAASWTAQLGRVRTTYTPTVGENIATVIAALMTSPALPRLSSPIRLATLDQYGTVHQAQDEQTYGDIGKWTSDLGLTVRETRAGGQQIMTHAQRWSTAVDQMTGRIPIIRSQALAPAKWQQDSEGIPRNHRITWGVGASTNMATWGNVSDPNAVIVDHDLTHARFNNEDQVRSEGFRLRALEWESAYAIPDVQIDLLQLITSPKKYDRDQASELLSLEVGAPIYLSGDWHSNLQGIHFVTGVTETITGAGWTLALSLAPSHLVVGSVSPSVPARAWASATHPWRDETRTWGAA